MPHFTASDGTNLFYLDEGKPDGVPLLCLSGLTRDSRDFDFVAPHLLDKFRLIRMDYRGRGQSDWAASSTYTVPQEGMDALALLDRLGLSRAAILGTSRGGLIAMGLAATVKERLIGVALNDIGPELASEGLTYIKGYLGKPPPWSTIEDAVAARKAAMTGFRNIPDARWRAHAETLYVQSPGGLGLTYDPKLRDAVLESAQPAPDLWPFFEALAGLPLCALRGETSDLLSVETFAEMKKRRPDMIAAEVADRGHVPFLDEPEALDALFRWIAMLH